MASSCMMLRRSIATSCVCNGKRNFRKFLLYGKRGSRSFKEKQAKNPDPEIPIDKRGTRDTGYKVGNLWVHVPEMVPELIVPSLEGFKLKPYVSYKVEDIKEPEFTAQDLFDLFYAEKIKEDFKNGQLDENGEPLNPNEYEKLTPQQAKDNAHKTGCDLFDAGKPLIFRITELRSHLDGQGCR
ncbi:39S ribosomal protein L41, mitochondrial isoform X2 [Pogonomyrmex barbatus]|uniref:39S ribosomal protein L41, mitochondrial isoform X2 n=1 Tax=Pogonomyrmex barbatus TaxID=144034 RepID=A0A6I9WRN2_9HYME|nr:39S ribosomal protein L41, mitochondrial isoform X2 [Pogonomyrmex barbatus]